VAESAVESRTIPDGQASTRGDCSAVDHRIKNEARTIAVQMRYPGRRGNGYGGWAMAVSRPEGAFIALPDPGGAGTLDDLVDELRRLKVWAGAPSYGTITARINAAWKAAGRPSGELARRATVADCFRSGRRRVNADLVVAAVEALHPDAGYVAQWRQALKVIAGEAQAASQVRTQDRLPPEVAGFTGRVAELDRLRRALHRGIGDGGAVVVSAIAGMAGVGKTQLAVHAGHQLVRDKVVDRVLFVNLRGFDPDRGQPPADPSAVLDGFLRLLGVPGRQIPHGLPARVDMYRARLTGTRTLIVADNAADAEQVRPLLPDVPGCPVLVTSRRSLTALPGATHLAVDVFTPDEALAFLGRAAAAVPAGGDPHAPARIADRCGRLPLALGLIAAHIRSRPGWTLTDHADRLDEHHRTQRLDAGVELALALSYRQLPAHRQRLLRLAAMHPCQNLDAHAAAALAGTDLPTARTHLRHLCRDHLLQQTTAGRYTLHDLVRAYAAGRAHDDDPPPERRAALTRLFDYYVAAATTAMDTLHPAETHRWPRIPPPATPTPALTGPDSALAWLETERPSLVAVAVHTATHGWPSHTTRLSTVLFRYLAGGHLTDALTVHGHARDAAGHDGDSTGRAHALTNLGDTCLALGRTRTAAEHLRQALYLFRQSGDPVGQARALGALGTIDARLGRYRLATDDFQRALTLCRQGGDRTGEAIAWGNLGGVDVRQGRYERAAGHYEHALVLFREISNRNGQAWALGNLGDADMCLGSYESAAEHLRQALALYRQLGNRNGEPDVLHTLGVLHTRLGRPAQATERLQQALALYRETGQRDGEASARNGLGEAARTAGHPADALTHHTDALATGTDDHHQLARAHTGLGHAHRTLSHFTRARHHYQRALALHTDLGTPQADRIRAHLAAVDDDLRCPASR
jgi:tetratricopeptide (TPR) repeat protein